MMTDAVADLLASIDQAKSADADALVEMMSAVTGAPPELWGTMVGFGRYRYKYTSGHEGETFLVGFAPRKAEFSIYLTGLYEVEALERRDALLTRLGKHRMGKACLYVKRLTDVDMDVLRELAALSVATLRQTYPQ